MESASSLVCLIVDMLARLVGIKYLYKILPYPVNRNKREIAQIPLAPFLREHIAREQSIIQRSLEEQPLVRFNFSRRHAVGLALAHWNCPCALWDGQGKERDEADSLAFNRTRDELRAGISPFSRAHCRSSRCRHLEDLHEPTVRFHSAISSGLASWQPNA
jgi:hypothetical protein